jgi:hypothetical protein
VWIKIICYVKVLLPHVLSESECEMAEEAKSKRVIIPTLVIDSECDLDLSTSSCSNDEAEDNEKKKKEKKVKVQDRSRILKICKYFNIATELGS